MPPSRHHDVALHAGADSVRVEWLRQGLLVNSGELSHAWGTSLRSFNQSCARNALFRLKIGKDHLYPAVFASLPAESVERINLALQGDDAVGKFIFWHRKHGGLGGRAVSQALKENMLDRVVELAVGWSEERGFGPAMQHP